MELTHDVQELVRREKGLEERSKAFKAQGGELYVKQ
jgi:hypothetical protein